MIHYGLHYKHQLTYYFVELSWPISYCTSEVIKEIKDVAYEENVMLIIMGCNMRELLFSTNCRTNPSLELRKKCASTSIGLTLNQPTNQPINHSSSAFLKLGCRSKRSKMETQIPLLPENLCISSCENLKIYPGHRRCILGK